MSHIHNIVDTGNRFVIDAESRTITNESESLVLSQGDHNSKRYTFEVPKIVEGHDMTLCNRIEIHYDNISRDKKERSEGLYIAKDIKVDGNNVTFTWLVSGNATRHAGTIQFWINFSCIDSSGEIVYSMGTNIFKSIKVTASNRNTEEIVFTFPDVLEQWRSEVLSDIDTSGVKHVAYLESPDDNGSIIYLRNLTEGVYVLKGEIGLYDGYATTIDFPNNILATVTIDDTTTYVQIMSAKNNTVMYFEITDDSVYRKDTELKNVPDETRVFSMINESLGVIENGSY